MTRNNNTPRLDVWRERLRTATAGHGTKAELARFVATERDLDPRALEIRIAKILAGMVPNGEDVLAITAWMDGKPPRRPSAKKTDGKTRS